VAASLGVADELAGGGRTSDELAEATGSDPGALYRLLRALATVGVVREEDGRRFTLTPIGELLRSDAPGSLAGWARFVGREHYWNGWGALGHSVRTGENAFSHVYGEDVWTWRSRRPDESQLFDAAMTTLTSLANRSLLEGHEWGRYGTVVDVAGGRGALLRGLLEEHPSMRGVLFDQPHVVEGADPHERLTAVSGSFFESVPEGGDAYVLKAIVHDWEDEEAAAILRVIRRAMRDDAALLVVERVLGPPNEDRDGKFSDLNMLVMPGGRERTLEEFDALLASAGFRLVGATPTPSGWNVIEAAPA
jgi:O-methyltransferase domain